jgi:hypothetical protein
MENNFHALSADDFFTWLEIRKTMIKQIIAELKGESNE